MSTVNPTIMFSILSSRVGCSLVPRFPSSYWVSVVFLNLNTFHSLPLSGVTLTVLQNRFHPPLETKTSCLHFVLTAISSWSGGNSVLPRWHGNWLRVSLLEAPSSSTPPWWCWLWSPHSIKGLSDFSTIWVLFFPLQPIYSLWGDSRTFLCHWEAPVIGWREVLPSRGNVRSVGFVLHSPVTGNSACLWIVRLADVTGWSHSSFFFF